MNNHKVWKQQIQDDNNKLKDEMNSNLGLNFTFLKLYIYIYIYNIHIIYIIYNI